MKHAVAILLLAAASAASAQVTATPRVGAQQLVRPAVELPVATLLPSCKIIGEEGSTGVIGEEGTTGIIGEEGSTGVIGEEGTTGIIGEEGSTEIIGEKRTAAGVLAKFSNSWNSDEFSTFPHVIEGPPGKVNLVLDACTTAGGGETVAVYLADANGRRKTGWRQFVIATKQGNSRSGSLTLPKPAAGQNVSRVPILVIVENASGRPHQGFYRLSVSR
jgi:hypothetical protein